ncbi:MAG: hypothetical protein AAB426_11805 [Myxococcota bacterium]
MSRVNAGDDTDSYCSRCGLELAHVVVAMNGARIVRVECKTCHTVHAHRRGAPSAHEPRARGSAPTRVPVHEREYERLLTGKDPATARPYAPQSLLDAGALVRHPTFGVGIVSRVLSDDKVQVIFRDAARVLVHARS